MPLNLSQCPWQTWVSTRTFQSGVFPSIPLVAAVTRRMCPFLWSALGYIHKLLATGKDLTRTRVQQELRGREAELSECLRDAASL